MTIFEEYDSSQNLNFWLSREYIFGSDFFSEIKFKIGDLGKLWIRVGLTNPVKLPKTPKFEKIENAKETIKDAIEKTREDQYIGTDH